MCIHLESIVSPKCRRAETAKFVVEISFRLLSIPRVRRHPTRDSRSGANAIIDRRGAPFIICVKYIRELAQFYLQLRDEHLNAPSPSRTTPSERPRHSPALTEIQFNCEKLLIY